MVVRVLHVICHLLLAFSNLQYLQVGPYVLESLLETLYSVTGCHNCFSLSICPTQLPFGSNQRTLNEESGVKQNRRLHSAQQKGYMNSTYRGLQHTSFSTHYFDAGYHSLRYIQTI